MLHLIKNMQKEGISFMSIHPSNQEGRLANEIVAAPR